MNIYLLGTHNYNYNTKLIFNSPKSGKSALIQEIFENSYLDQWKKIQAHQDFRLPRAIAIVTKLEAELSIILPKASNPRGNHEFEFKGTKITVSKLSEYFTEAYQLYRLHSQLEFSLNNLLELYMFDINLLGDEDCRLMLSMIFKIGKPIKTNNLKFIVNGYIRDNQIHHAFVKSFEECVSLLIRGNFLKIKEEIGSQFYQITEKTIQIKRDGV